MVRHTRTDASKRYGLPEVPGKESRLSGQKKRNYSNLDKLGTQPHDIREIIYHNGELTRGELKHELNDYGYNSLNSGVLKLLDEETNEIKREGSKDETVITWVGERSRDMAPTEDQPEENLRTEENVTWVKNDGTQALNLPTHENVDVVSYATISKNDEWWKAVVRYDHYGEDRIAVYLWRKNGADGWTRKQKYSPRSPEDWEQDKQIVEEGVGKTK